MKGNELKRAIIDYIDRMPSLPTSVSKVMEICQNPAANPSDLNKVISLDPVLLARIMKLINSAYYGLSQEVTSLVRAIIMLGINTVKNLALSTAVLGSIKGSKQGKSVLNLDSFWKHSLCVGVANKLLAKHRKVDPKEWEGYFICGLLHDIGKVPLNYRAPDELLASIQESDRSRIPLHQGESAILELTHEDAGGLIVEKWQLGDEILDAVSFHHRAEVYQGNHKTLVYSTAVANYYANSMEIGFSGDRFAQKPSPEVFSFLGIQWQDMEALDDQVAKEIDKAKIFLNITD